jgi:hypothetical protein
MSVYNANLSEPQRALVALMEEISEQHYSAGWIDDLESRLWAEMHEREQGVWVSKRWRPAFVASMAELRRLHELTGGWAVAGDFGESESDDPNLFGRFVPGQEWDAIRAAREAK